ncbi:peptidase inhibitor family I36 protein [uncultured Nostoc sp.]|uniref:peptidase inhibitor family I36 protein n=1 Tax=uncultured Nostoc sp. TaxID=340711 RepID=UPI0035CA2926
MSNINNQTQDLYSIELVQDLDHEAAATVSGGALYLFDNPNAGGEEEVLIAADANLGALPGVNDFSNKASSYKVTGTRSWYVYTQKNYKGTRYTLKAGTKGNFFGTYLNNNIESAKPAPQYY